MTLIVTGGAGFIGANFILYMANAHPDMRIVCIDKLTYAADLHALRDVAGRSNFRFVHADICDRNSMFGLFDEERPDAVVNFAAESHVDRSIEAPGLFIRTNVGGTANLLDACLACGVKRFHQISTDEVYGDLPIDRPEKRFTEASPLRPSSPYSASKASADLLVMAYHRTYGLNATVSRCSNNYGPYQHAEKLIPRMIACAMKDCPMPVYGSGLNVRDWIHVTDHCRAVDMILQNGRAGGVYNVGSDCEVANIDLVRRICRMLGKPESLITHVEDRKGHDLRYAIDAGKLRRETGWRPEVAFDEGLQSTVRWYAQRFADREV